MKAGTAGLFFLAVCVILAVLLILDVITPIVSGAVFAIALVLLGGASGGFRKR